MSSPVQEQHPPPRHSLERAPSSIKPTNSNDSTSNAVSMPFVRRHVTRRLKAAKAECDKELQRVTNSITAWFEERLRDGDNERETERELREMRRDADRDYSALGDGDVLREPFAFLSHELRSALQAEESGSDGGYEAELESSRPGRQRASIEDSSTKPPLLTHWSSSPGLHTVSLTPSLSPSLRRQSTLPREKPLSTSNSSNGASTSPTTAWPAQSISSRRLSRTIHIPIRPTQSAQSSRSTSRSRSPLPPSAHPNCSDSYSSLSSASSINRRSSRILVDDPVDPIMTALYDLIAVATDVTDMSLAQLTAQPKLCEGLVQRVQNIGKAWDEHPDWNGRNWYVQVLLAIASLSRVVEWWEAEKQFWNFDDNEDEEDEPLAFVTKPAEEPSSAPTPVSKEGFESQTGNVPTTTTTAGDNDSKLRLTRPPSQGRKPREEPMKSLAVTTSPQEPSPRADAKNAQQTESARVLATERLRLQAEMAQNQNIVLELSLDGDHFLWANYAWRVVVGTDPDDLPGTRISHHVAPDEWDVFRLATQRLQDDQSHTVEVKFTLRVQPEDDWEPAGRALFQQMEGKGMLMVDREDGRPSHTMWVIKPIAAPCYQNESTVVAEPGQVGDETLLEANRISNRDASEPITPFPFNQPISVEPILCRICDAQIPQWYFEKHSETCVETHRLEAEICDCNELISELRNTIRELSLALERSSPMAPPEYRGMPIFSPSTSPSLSSPLQLFRANKFQRMAVKRMQRRLLEQLDDILQVVLEVEIPSLQEEESKEPIERQRLLPPNSERKITQIRTWCKPNTEDAALSQLVQDVERVMRQKIDNVVRMQNTIRYSEKIRNEWQEEIAETIAVANEFDDDDDSSNSDEARAYDGQFSSTSEFALIPSSDPTPMASTSAVPYQAQSKASPTPSYMENRIAPPSSVVSPTPAPPPVSFPHSRPLHTRSSTPSSISSPLALAAPIVAPSYAEETPPHMELDTTNLGPSVPKLAKRKSAQNLSEPMSLLTPPLSPLVSPRDGSRRDRRHSAAPRPSALHTPGMTTCGPISPAAPLSRTTPTSINDFEIIKPISKGAFGSVFLAKKKATGDYYAIKVLKKADMIAKNQITNVKAERMILIQQADSPFVAKLYFTFQSKENLYLVMEYLNGGDCAALVKSIGALPEQWTKNYIAEVVLGLEYLHQRGVVHRDLKPDNLLIDSHGHLKLTDFGLSRIGLFGRQTRQSQLLNVHHNRYRSRSRPPSMDSGYLSSPLFPTDVLGTNSYFGHRSHPSTYQGHTLFLPHMDDASETSGSESLSSVSRLRSGKLSESPSQSFATELASDLRSHSILGETTSGEQRFVGTPDYLAPETILGMRGDDASVDWWALGVITYEFLYGIPPFHADTPERVFENILSGHVEWHEAWIDYSSEARDFMQRLLVVDPTQRLGANGSEEVKAHPFFKGIDWDKVTTTKAVFIPNIDDPESTDYFDPRGAVPQLFRDDEPVAISSHSAQDSTSEAAPTLSIPTAITTLFSSNRDSAGSPAGDDFGSFSFKNLPVLKQANDDVIRKLKTDKMMPMSQTLADTVSHHIRRKSISQRLKKPPSVVTNTGDRPSTTNPPSPATSTSSLASSPSRISQPPSTPGSAGSHARKPSEYGAVERFKLNHHLEGGERRNSMPSRLRTASVSSMGDGSGSEIWPSSVGHGSGHFEVNTPPSSVHSVDLKRVPDLSDRAVTCLLAEDNPITAKIIETLLIRLGCRCVVVADGSEAISVAMGDIKFDCILMDLHMPVVDGEGAARYIKSTNSKNTNTPIVAISAYGGLGSSETGSGSVFTASLAKPVQKSDLLAVMRKLGFKTSAVQGSTDVTKITARRVQSSCLHDR